MTSPAQLKNDILATVRGYGAGGVRRPDLRRALNCRGGGKQAAFKEVFRQLMEDGRLMRKRGGRYVLSKSAGLVAGEITVNGRGGFGFVKRSDAPGTQDIFVPPGRLAGAISGDSVLVRVVDEEDERGPSGHVEKITERKHTTVVGCLEETYEGLVVRPMLRELPDRLTLKGGIPEGTVPGDWILAQLLPQDGADDELRAAFVRRLAEGSSVVAILDAVAMEFELPEPYSGAEESAAAARQPEHVDREDRRELTVVTIDPEDAKDFDDALSIELLEDGVAEVGVHIADVAVHVPAGSDLDRWAFERGFTHYLPGRTLHMLPRSLAAERCSLREGEESLAHSVFLTLDLETGEVRGCRRAHTSIRVDKRLSFDDVSEFLANDRRPTADQSVHDTLAALARVAGTLRRRREEKEAFLALHMPEIRVLCSESPPRVHGLKRVEPNPAHELVEEFMLLANTAVARELGALQMPGVFRVHEEPRPADMEEFAEWAGQALGRKPGRLDDRHRLNAFLASLEQAPLRQVVLSTFLRALPRAAYSAADAGHYGLGKANYCHFTSPIRRYPDLLVHQQLLARDLGRSPRSLEACARVAEHTSSTQENADRAYFAASDRLKAMYLKQLREQDPGRLHQGVIGKVSGSGLLVYLDEFGLYGHLDAKRLGEGRFRKDRRTHALRDARSGKIYKCGDVIHVHILRADPARGEVHLEPARSVF